ncbi:hypothetical protein B0H63DRAFT_29186 [Podospora didyma]|uniref:Secreted protein n=1 Tax=Podospora didyma TaxID=330526 RepID=A0AAE0U7V4_9PEZI|nr:hypothetical protein B0H63DRAFT_29186 [Podospora didyma]
MSRFARGTLLFLLIPSLVLHHLAPPKNPARRQPRPRGVSSGRLRPDSISHTFSPVPNCFLTDLRLLGLPAGLVKVGPLFLLAFDAVLSPLSGDQAHHRRRFKLAAVGNSAGLFSWDEKESIHVLSTNVVPGQARPTCYAISL